MRFVDVGGVEVAFHFEESPDASRDIILVHGAGFDHSVWRFQTRFLAARGFRVFAPDLPGHGSSAGVGMITIADMSEWVVGFTAATGAVAPTVVGHSMGSLIALETAARHPAAVSGIVLIAASDQMSVHPELLGAAADGDHHAVQLMIGWMHSGDLRLGGHRSPGTWSAGLTRRLLERNLDVLHGDLLACDSYDPITAAARVVSPTLVISGVDDHMTVARSGAALSDAISDAQFVAIPGAGHVLMSETSGPVNDAILAHLRRQAPSR